MWLHSNYSHLSDLYLLSSFVILQSVTFQSCNVVRHFPVLQIQVTLFVNSLFLFKCIGDECLRMYRTDLHQIFRIGRHMGADDELTFVIRSVEVVEDRFMLCIRMLLINKLEEKLSRFKIGPDFSLAH